MGATSTKSRTAAKKVKTFESTPERTRLFRRLAAIRKAAGMDYETYHDKIRALYGVESGTNLTTGQLVALAERLERETGPKRRRFPKGKPLAAKVHKLWSELGKSGHVRNSSRAALRQFCGRFARDETGAPLPENARVDPDMMPDEVLQKVIEALKNMQNRAAQGSVTNE